MWGLRPQAAAYVTGCMLCPLSALARCQQAGVGSILARFPLSGDAYTPRPRARSPDHVFALTLGNNLVEHCYCLKNADTALT